MANQIEVELVEMDRQDSSCTIPSEPALVFTNMGGDHRGVPWASLSEQPWAIDSPLNMQVIDGFDIINLALYISINDDNNAVYVIFKKAP